MIVAFIPIFRRSFGAIVRLAYAGGWGCAILAKRGQVDLTAARRGRPARWLFLARLCATARDWTPGLAGATTKTSAAAETPAVALGDKTPKKRVEGGASTPAGRGLHAL